MKLLNSVLMAAVASEMSNGQGQNTARNAAVARKEARAIKKEEGWTSKDILLSETLKAWADKEAEAYLADFKQEEPGLIKAEEANKSLSVHCLELARKSYTLGRIGHSRVLWFTKLSGIVEGYIIRVTGVPTKDATGNAYSVSAMLAQSRAGASWKTYKSEIRQALLTKTEDGEFINLMEKDSNGNFVIANYQDARNAVREIRNAKQVGNQGNGTTEEDEDTDGIVADEGGALDYPKVASTFARLKAELRAADWPENPTPETMHGLMRAISAATKQVSEIRDLAVKGAKKPEPRELPEAKVTTEHADGSKTVVGGELNEDEDGEELPGVVEDSDEGTDAPDAAVNE